MLKNEKGMTLVEVLATLILLTLVTGLIWTAISIASQFNISETTELKLQQEANYIVSQLQQVHRHCHEYKLEITENEVKVKSCLNKDDSENTKYSGIISNKFQYASTSSGTYKPAQEGIGDLDLDLTITGKKVNEKRVPRSFEIKTIITRYKANEKKDSE